MLLNVLLYDVMMSKGLKMSFFKVPRQVRETRRGYIKDNRVVNRMP